MEILKRLHILGLDYRTTPVAVREKFALSSAEARVRLRRALAEWTDELVVIQTCNRFELVYLTSGSAKGVRRGLIETLCSRCGVAAATVTEHLITASGRDAVLHLYRVAAGLESMVLGEPQILGQVKDGFAEAEQLGTAGKGMNCLQQQMLHAAKAVRTETAIGKGRLSLASLAAIVARDAYTDLGDRVAVVVGSGSMGRLAAAELHKAGIGTLRIVNRSQPRAAAVAEEFGGECFDFARLSEVVADADIVVGATSCPLPVLDAAALIRGGARQRVLVDLAVPRDFAADVCEVPGVQLWDVDDLRAVASRSRQQRQAEIAEAERILNAKIDGMIANINAKVGPVIRDLHQHAGQICEDEFERLVRQLGDLSEAEQQEIRRSMNLVLGRLLHQPISGLRKSLAEPEAVVADDPIASFRHLFSLQA
jgi:glutamyl-tRNA reductase